MSFIPVFTTHSSHIYFAFILHLFMFSLVISDLTKALGWSRSHMTCKFTDPCHLCSKAVSLEKQVATCFSHIQNAVTDVRGCRFSSRFESLWLILVVLNNLYVFFLEAEVRSPNQVSAISSTSAEMLHNAQGFSAQSGCLKAFVQR